MTSVLIVDDSLTVRMDLEAAFAGGGFAPTLCPDAGAARTALATGSFDLVVLDVVLPDGDGFDLLGEIRASPSHGSTPVVMFSSEAEARQRVRGLQRGADEYVGKPYDPERLVARARELVRIRGEPAGDAAERAPVLVVDDSATAREELRLALEGAGLPVLTASSGEDGIRLAAERRPAAVVVDGLMPGMDGTEFVRRLRSDPALATTPCILVSASGAVSELEALGAGADGFAWKEEGHAVALARVQALLRTGRPAAAGAAGLLAPRRIAVVGSGPRAREVAERLRADGHDVAPAASTDDAVGLAEVDRVDAVVLDATCSLHEGIEAARRMRAERSCRSLPLIVVGRDDDRTAAVAVLQAGADDYVAASIGPEVLRARVQAALRRKQLEDDQREREAYARSAAILETIADAFFAVDRGWRLVYANRALAAVAGVADADLLGAPLWTHAGWVAEGPFEQELRRAVESGAAATFEVRSRHDRWYEVRAFPHAAGLSAHLRDVTDRHRSDEVHRHLVGIVSHDLRTPLTATSMSIQMLARDGGLTERQRRCVERAESGTVRMTRLISDLLDYSRARLGQGLPIHPRPTDLDAVCRTALDEVRAAHPGRVVDYRPGTGGEGTWDPDRLAQVLGNLLTNAVRYSPETSAIELAWVGGEGHKLVTVHNDGPPIGEPLLSQLFEPFRRGADRGERASRGVGLGLYIVRELVRAHGGTVEARSSKGAGTTFTVRLPAP
ncbi:MAG TPA: response regulator [Anaeromyxobacteraceae bacterium]|nr:response regulator [Anaeromyxobacteraceae bacterium]